MMDIIHDNFALEFNNGDVEAPCMASANAMYSAHAYSAKAVPFMEIAQRLCYECGEVLDCDEYDEHIASHDTECLVHQLVQSELHHLRRIKEAASRRKSGKSGEKGRGSGRKRKRVAEIGEGSTLIASTSSPCFFPAATIQCHEVRVYSTTDGSGEDHWPVNEPVVSDATRHSCLFNDTSNRIIVPDINDDIDIGDECAIELENLPISDGCGKEDDDDDEEIDVGTNPPPGELLKDLHMIEANIGPRWANVYVKVFHIDEQIRTIFEGVAEGKTMRRNPSRGARPSSGSMSDRRKRRASVFPSC